MPRHAPTRTPLVATFIGLGAEYWLRIYPEARRQLAQWQKFATTIPDATLRRHALETHRDKHTHAEGAAAFAVLAPTRSRRGLVRGLVAFQALYDYLDTVSEQPSPDARANARQLHGALVDALDPEAPQRDYYALNPEHDDGHYLARLIESCQQMCRSLPSYAVVAPALRAAAVRAMESQGHNHALSVAASPSPVQAAARWAGSQAPESDCRWWELVGAAGSSLAMFALIAAASDPTLTDAQRDAVLEVYFPWAGALLALVDSLVDLDCDRQTESHSLIGRYVSPDETAERLSLIAGRALATAQGAPQGQRHTLIIMSMVALFLSAPEAGLPDRRDATAATLGALGSIGRLPLLILRAKRRLSRVR